MFFASLRCIWAVLDERQLGRPSWSLKTSPQQPPMWPRYSLMLDFSAWQGAASLFCLNTAPLMPLEIHTLYTVLVHMWPWLQMSTTHAQKKKTYFYHICGLVQYLLSSLCKIKIIISSNDTVVWLWWKELKDSNLFYFGDTEEHGSRLKEKPLCVADGERRLFRDEDREEDYNHRRRRCRPRTGELRWTDEMWMDLKKEPSEVRSCCYFGWWIHYMWHTV